MEQMTNLNGVVVRVLCFANDCEEFECTQKIERYVQIAICEVVNRSTLEVGIYSERVVPCRSGRTSSLCFFGETS